MKKTLVTALTALTLCLTLIIAGHTLAGAEDEAPFITKDELKAKLDAPDLILLDVRSQSHWDESTIKIKGAIREDKKQFKAWSNKYPKDKTLVLYCACANEGTSSELVESLRDLGYAKAYALEGGWREWENAKYPTENK
jgi:rhodanese-related sulfurtransferase